MLHKGMEPDPPAYTFVMEPASWTIRRRWWRRAGRGLILKIKSTLNATNTSKRHSMHIGCPTMPPKRLMRRREKPSTGGAPTQPSA
ncbi:hypothetical protein COP2_022556 [Malus domestica]